MGEINKNDITNIENSNWTIHMPSLLGKFLDDIGI